jgi:hypothetical protein
MTTDTYSDETIKAVQEAQNTLTAFYGAFMAALGKVVTELPLHFIFWKPYDYAPNAPSVTLKLWKTPIFSTDYATFSHLPLIDSTHHFSTLDAVTYNKNVPARKGDAMVTFFIYPNKAILDVDYDQEWPTTLPVEGPLARVIAYKLTADDDSSLSENWEPLEYPEDIGPVGEALPTENPKVLVWARAFDLIQFLNDPSRLFGELLAFLKEGSEA